MKASRWETTYRFQTLPDYLCAGLDIVFIGINPGLYSVNKGHYFARSTSRFWPGFSASRLSVKMRNGLGVGVLGPEHDRELVRFGFGITDVVKKPSGNATGVRPDDFAYWIPQLINKLRHYAPRVACFHGLTAYRPFLKVGLAEPTEKPSLGPQPHTIDNTRIFVAPNPSPANAHFRLSDQTDWYNKLGDFVSI